jgi:ATP-dependent RNA helicase DeaD
MTKKNQENSTNKSFSQLNLKKNILSALEQLGFENPLEVQEEVIPKTLTGKNIVFIAKTGSGKTLAYSLGFLGKINTKQNLQMLIITPTRELCIQVGKELQKICDLLDINVGILYGGRDIKGDYKTLNKKNQILVATPGRLIMHVNEKSIKLGEVKCVVYDESDQMFDNGFYKDCAYIKKRISKESQIILSSATITQKVENFIEDEIVDYEFMQIGNMIPKNIVQEKIYCEKIEKNEIMKKFLISEKAQGFKRSIVFCNTKIKSTGICEFLKNHSFKSYSLNGNMTQKERDNCLKAFKQGNRIVLVSTDVAARGLHIENVDIVINYDIPTKAEFYIHRIGRTGRLDKKGYSLSLICPEDEARLKLIEFDYDLNINELKKEDYL